MIYTGDLRTNYAAQLASSFPSAGSTSATSSGSGQSATTKPIDYMKLIVAQMQNMNPMDPSSGGDSTGMMMQAEELSLLSTLNQGFTQLQQAQQASYGAGLIGRSVAGTGADGQPASGVVTGLEVVSGNVLLQLQSGALVAVTNVTSVQQQASGSSATTSPVALTHGVPAG